MSDLSAEAIISLIGVLLSVPAVVVLLCTLSYKYLSKHPSGTLQCIRTIYMRY